MKLANNVRVCPAKRAAAISLLTFGVLFCASTSAVAQTAVSETVAQFFPQSLIDLNNRIDEPLKRHQCFQVIATDRTGAPEAIFATYTDGYRAVARVLTKGASGFQVAAEPSGLLLWGLDCAIALVDLAPDRRRVIHLSFQGGVHTVDWLFAWNGRDLSNYTPLVDTDLGGSDSQLIDADFVDLDRDGTLELVSRTESAKGVPAPKIFRWSSGRYVLASR